MRVVLYTHDLEPITVIDLKPWAHEFLVSQGSVRMAVHRPAAAMMSNANALPCDYQMNAWFVEITAEVIRRGMHESLMLFTDNEEAALLLKSELLPGQIRDSRELQKVAFAKGFMHAIDSLGRRW
jgi:hypothetical protein